MKRINYNSISVPTAYKQAFFKGEVEENNLKVTFRYKNIPKGRQKNPDLTKISDGKYTWILTEKRDMYIAHVGIFELGTKHLHLIKGLNESIIAAGEFEKMGDEFKYNLQSGTFKTLNKKVSEFVGRENQQILESLNKSGHLKKTFHLYRIPPEFYTYADKKNNNKEEKEKPKSHGAFKRAVIKAALRNIIEKSSKS